jgi:hypothetical protein
MSATLDDRMGATRPEPPRERGRTTLTPRALDRLVCAVTADTLRVPARAVHVDLSDRNGLLALQIRTPIRVVSLDRVQQSRASIERSGGTIIQRAADAQTTIRERVTDLTGTEIAHVSVWLTGIETEEERRVT